MAQQTELDALRRAVQTQAQVLRERTAPEPETEEAQGDIESAASTSE